MKAHIIGKGFAAAAACCVMVLVSVAALAAAPSWRWRVDVFPAAGTNEVALLASSGGEISWVRWNRVAGPANTAASEAQLECVSDGWLTSLGTFSVSNEVSSNAVSAASGSVSATNAQWRIGDKLIIRSSGITGGTVAVGYWYYE